MLLSLTQIFSSRASSLLFLVSYLLLWENVYSTSTCAERNATIQDSLEKLLQLTTFISHVVSSETAKLLTEFNNQYAHGKRYNERIPGTCHTALFDTPVNKEQSLGSNPKTLLKFVHSLLNSWTNALNHLVNEMSAMQGDPSSLISKAREIQAKFHEITTGVQTTLSMIGERDNETYLAWSGLSSLQSSNEDVRCFSFHTMIRCLLRDSRKINTYLEVIKYKMVDQNNC
ncbi:prolactin-2B1-like [Grammomys surdaster]|uniref:prolactin-2B1-like n=1 Tax=Grammomys surdaster TaxID=491861 RepID=UPI00109EFF57|nr:prolactin-2B1-like [Grammomys surdaster]